MFSSTWNRGLVGVALILFTMPALTRADVVVPSSAYLTNVLGDDFRTDVRVLNPGSAPIFVTPVFYRQTNDAAGISANTITVGPVTIPAGGQVAFDNILSTLFGQAAGVFGPIRFETAAPIFVSSATNNVNGCNHTGAVQGQWIPGIDVADAITQGTLLQLAASTDLASGYRTNVVFFNPSDTATATVSATLRKGDGTLVSGATFPLGNGPSGFKQINRFSTDFAPPVSLSDTNLFLEFTSDQPVLSFASVINNVSGDPFALTPVSEQAAAAGVTSLNTLVGAVTLAGASNIAVSRSGQTLTVSGPTALPPTGPAGGALTGTYPNPGIAGGPFARLTANTFTGTQTITGGNLALPETTGPTVGVLTLDGSPFLHSFPPNSSNTLVGKGAGGFQTTGGQNSGFGAGSLSSNTTGGNNSAFGVSSLMANTTGSSNSAFGIGSLISNTTGGQNSAFGQESLKSNGIGSANAAFGNFSLSLNTNGQFNAAFGWGSLRNNTIGRFNAAFGGQSLILNTEGANNVAFGMLSLSNNTTGSNNIAIGRSAGESLTTGNDNIDIGNAGVAAESGTIRVGTAGTHTKTFISGIRGVTVTGGIGVVIDANGQLGTTSSSARYKHDIQDMGDLSARLMQLRPVTFRYNAQGADAPLRFGLVAEEVNEVLPELVARNKDGEIETVMYHELPAMLLNEIQKQRRAIDGLESEREALGRMVRELSERVAMLEGARK